MFLLPKTDFFSAILSSVLVDLANEDRQKSDLGFLKPNPLLAQAAQRKADDMSAKGYFNHYSPDGAQPWDWLDLVGYDFCYAGENLAVNFVDSEKIEEAWMASESHRANILNGQFTEIGVATARGEYQGQETIFVVQFFGRPAEAPAAPLKNQVAAAAVKPAPPKAEAKNPEKTVSPGGENFMEKGSPSVAGEQGEKPSAPEQKTLPKPQALWWQKILAMPFFATNLIYLSLAGMIILALVLKIFVKIRIQYPKLIFNGVLLLFLVISSLYFNYLLVGQGMIVASF